MTKRRDRNKSGLTPAVINHLKAKNISQAEIARRFSVTPQYVSWIKKEYGGIVKSPKETMDEVWPFDVKKPFHAASPYARLRDHLNYMATGGKDMSHERLILLKGFYVKLRSEGVVVEYDPEIPPTDGVAYTGGWAFRPRQESDGGLIIRVNEHTKELTEEMEMVWQFPPDDPESPVPAPR